MNHSSCHVFACLVLLLLTNPLRIVDIPPDANSRTLALRDELSPGRRTIDRILQQMHEYLSDPTEVVTPFSPEW